MKKLFAMCASALLLASPLSVFADAPSSETDAGRQRFYANGNAVILTDGTTDGNTVVYNDVAGDGKVDAEDSIVEIPNATGKADASGYDLSDFSIFGGGNADLTADTKITMLGGQVGLIYGANFNSDLKGDSTIDIKGGQVLNQVYGGGVGGDMVGNVEVSVAKAENVKWGVNLGGVQLTGSKVFSTQEPIFTGSDEVHCDATGVIVEAVSTFRIGILGEAVIDGTEMLYVDAELGESVTVKATGEDFAFWADVDTGAIVSKEKDYTFLAAKKINLTPVYNQNESVNFVSDYGQLMYRWEYVNDQPDSTELPAVPAKLGYEAIGWNKTVAEIDAEIKAGDDVVVTVTPVYEKIQTKYTLNVVNGSGSGEYSNTEQIRVKADAPEAGMRFANWTDLSGNAINYYPEFNILLSKEETTITANYVKEDVVVEEKAQTGIVESIKAGGKTQFISEHSVPVGCEIIQAGVMVKVGDKDFKQSEAAIVSTSATDAEIYRYTLTINTTKTIAAKSILVYKDANGVVNTVYGDVVVK